MNQQPNADKENKDQAHLGQTSRWRILIVSFCALLAASIANAQEAERWFQIEVSVFSNELASDRNEEYWSAERTALSYPDRITRLQTLFELLLIPSLISSQDEEQEPGTDSLEQASEFPEAEPSAQEIRQQIIAETGPFPPDGGDTYRFPDFERDAFLQLPASESEFQQTNRALERSAEHRLLFHGLWRQPMPDPGNETPIFVQGGERFGSHSELEGSLSLHFNSGRDRVVIDANLWLSEFSRLPGGGILTDSALGDAAPGEGTWQLPEPPSPAPSFLAAEPGEVSYSINRVYHMRQSRDMRSTEFHYLDHPAIGIVVTVFPYEVPELPEEETDADF